jgi:hypothetical protein
LSMQNASHVALMRGGDSRSCRPRYLRRGPGVFTSSWATSRRTGS